MKYLILSCITVAVVMNTQGQIQNGSINYEDAMRPAAAVIVELPYDEARSYYEDFIEENYDVKVKGNGIFANKDILLSEQVKIAALGDQAIDLLAAFEEVDESTTRVMLSARQGYDLFYSADLEPERYEKLKAMLLSFDNTATTDYHQSILNDQQDALGDAKRTNEKLKKSIESNQEDIADNLKENEKLKKEIEELEESLQQNEKQLERTKEKIEKSKQVLN